MAMYMLWMYWFCVWICPLVDPTPNPSPVGRGTSFLALYSVTYFLKLVPLPTGEGLGVGY
ncbi:hypothetical protein SAMN00120144_2332 [Hymenobacter roseosalivarius DSM 11622]|uniref:Uncharacterized protein n=1 Tax=Hymenobacter roseosalivarius DSM 11622 TaxID=645990 RepID=A0A1W1VL28_9BACT|nr:hypothetical protein SAMN00120144_2332 [Hymenobacter roseosalivarius DSM 11622]